ncbi:MAG: hypothetical protein IIB15_04095 [Chloroflexi bacterium]|nr:hypothetical protein [Chloroflexota bacterium]
MVKRIDSDQDPKVTSWLRLERIKLYPKITIVLLFGIVLILFAHSQLEGFWEDFSIDVGIALVIASVVALVVERYLKEQLFLEIANRVTDILASFRTEVIDASQLQRLPTELLTVVREAVLDNPVIEREITAHYKMEVIQLNGQQVLKTVINTKGVYENVTSEWQQVEVLEIGVSIDDEYRQLVPRQEVGFVAFEVMPIEGEIKPQFSSDKRGMANWVSQRDTQEIFRRSIRFSPHARAMVKSTEIGYFELDGWDSYIMQRPTINMEISISIPAGEFKVSGEPTDESLLDHLETSIDDAAGKYRWRINRGLLPGQGLEIYWEPVDDTDGTPE